MRSIGLPEVLVLCGVLVLVGFALLLLTAALRGKQSRSVQRALIDKLPPDQLAALLQTPQGEKLMRALAETGTTPGRSILASVERGIIVILLGAGMLAAARFTRVPSILLAPSIILIFLGFGTLLAAFVSYRLSKRWHLLEGNGDGQVNRRAD